MSEPLTKKVRPSHIIIAVLVAIVLLQTAALIYHGQRPAPFEKEQQGPALRAQGAVSAAHPKPHPPALGFSHASPPGFMDEDPWEALDQMSQRMSGLMRHSLMFGSPLFQNMPQGAGFDFTPAVDLEETKDAYIVKSDLPGLEKDKIDLTVRENVLTIEGVRETASKTEDQKKGYYAQERSYGSFARSLSLPGPVDESKISAVYKNGVLTITLPKVPGQSSAQKVAVQ